MKEVLANPSDKLDRPEITCQQEARKEIRLIGQQRRIPGLTLWEYNSVTGEVKPATFKRVQEIITFGKYAMVRPGAPRGYVTKVLVQHSCWYVQALNLKNARRKFGLPY